jgi:hypothetical protein
MASKIPRRRRDLKMLEYVIEDFLDLKARLDAKRAKPLKKFLLSRRLQPGSLSSIEGFHLARQLVLIVPRRPHSFEHLVFLNPVNGAIQVKRIS